jgi:hypothetical protein
MYTPLVEPRRDDAHADLVTFLLTMADKQTLRDWLQKVVSCARPDKLNEIEKLRKEA